VLQACKILEPKSKRAGKPHAFRIEVQAYAVGSSARVEGTASKTVEGVKFIVHAESADRKEEWLKCLSDGGAFVPTIRTLTKLGDAKKQLNRLGIHRRKKGEDTDHEAEAAGQEDDEEDSD
jgi:hypothetical protein